MIKEKDFYCQFESYSNERLAKSLCGITCVAMVLSAEDRLGHLKSKDKNLDIFLEYVIGLHKNNKDAVKRKFKLGDKDLYVTVGFVGEVKVEEHDTINNDNEFMPVFVLFRGYDHRCSKFLFSKFGMEADLAEGYSPESLFNDIYSGKARYFMSSVKSRFVDHEATIAPTHIVVVNRACIADGGEKMLQLVDPSEKSFKSAVRTLSLREFSLVYNGFGTYIK